MTTLIILLVMSASLNALLYFIAQANQWSADFNAQSREFWFNQYKERVESTAKQRATDSDPADWWKEAE